MEYASVIGGGGRGVRPLFIFSSLKRVTYCIGGKGNELTCEVSAILSQNVNNLRGLSTKISNQCLEQTIKLTSSVALQ